MSLTSFLVVSIHNHSYAPSMREKNKQVVSQDFGKTSQVQSFMHNLLVITVAVSVFADCKDIFEFAIDFM